MRLFATKDIQTPFTSFDPVFMVKSSSNSYVPFIQSNKMNKSQKVFFRKNLKSQNSDVTHLINRKRKRKQIKTLNRELDMFFEGKKMKDKIDFLK